MKYNKKIIEHRYDERIPRLIRMRFAGFKYRINTKEYEAEFVDNECAPRPIYENLACSKNGRYIRCCTENGDDFYSWYVPAKNDNMPLLVVLPGYDARIRSYPDVSDKYNLLFVSPLGYSTPTGFDESKKSGGTWPVLYNTLYGSKKSYSDWIMDVLTVIKFVGDDKLADTDRIIFAGTSQGGALAMILASYFAYTDKRIVVCADLPFLVGYSTGRLNDLIYNYPPPPEIRFRVSEAKKRMALVDPEWHLMRMRMPVLITSSDIDTECPEKEIENLFYQLPQTTRKTYICYKGRPHGYSKDFFEDMMKFLDELQADGYFEKRRIL